MPYKRNYKKRPARRRNIGLATRPRLMGKTTALRRFNQVNSRVFYFKNTDVINTTASGTGYLRWSVNTQLALNAQIQNFFNVYDQYKILGMVIKLYPANVGIEAHDTLLGTSETLLRGNHIIWNDQRFDPNQQIPTAVTQVINTASARLINPRRPYTRSIWRPRGKPSWGSTKDFQTSPDPWTGCIQHLFTDSTPVPTTGNLQALYYWTCTLKVVFRGRCQD